MDIPLSRRELLRISGLLVAGGGLVSATGCRIGVQADEPPTTAQIRDQLAVELAQAQLAGAASSAQTQDAVLAAVHANTQKHVDALATRLGGATPSPSASGSPSLSAGATATVQKGQLGAAGEAVRNCRDAPMGPDYAELLASIAASNTCHAVLLGAQAPPVETAGVLKSRDAEPVKKLQEALRAQHAAVFAYGVIGSRLTGEALAQARRLERAHRNRREMLSDSIAARGAEPVPAEPSYKVPFAVDDEATAFRFATQVESRTCTHWRVAVGAMAGADRLVACSVVAVTATSAMAWRQREKPGEPAAPAFPGVDAE